MSERPTSTHLGRSDSGSVISAAVGDSIQITLPENPTTGHLWEFVELPAGLDVVDEVFSGIAEGAPGGGGSHSWQLTATDMCEGPLRMRCRQPWELADLASDHFEVRILVT